MANTYTRPFLSKTTSITVETLNAAPMLKVIEMMLASIRDFETNTASKKKLDDITNGT